VATCGFEPHGRWESIGAAAEGWAAPVARRRRLAQSGVPACRSVPGCSSVPGSGLVGRRPFWTPAAAPIDAQVGRGVPAVPPRGDRQRAPCWDLRRLLGPALADAPTPRLVTPQHRHLQVSGQFAGGVRHGREGGVGVGVGGACCLSSATQRSDAHLLPIENSSTQLIVENS